MIRVLIAEDSAVTREYLVSLLAAPLFEVVATAADGVEAAALAQRLRPHVILMDIQMPRMDGLEATRRIMESIPTPIVLVTAAFDRDDTAMSFEGIRAGAVTVVGKPAGPGHPDHARSVEELRNTVRLMSEVKVLRRWPRRDRPRPAPPVTRRQIRTIAVGASTGGPAALAEIFGDLDRDIGAPLLVVQHIARGFADGLAQWLSDQTPLSVKVAVNGDPTRAGTIYIAPDGWQMTVGPDDVLQLSPALGDEAFCPSASHLFESVARSFGRGAIGVLLTGMGRDGVTGLKTLREAGAVTIAQDEATSAIFGMPKEAVRAGAAEYVLPPKEIARLIRSLAGDRR